MKPFELYLAAHPWRGSSYPRPYLLIRPATPGRWACFPISTKDYDSEPFEVRLDDPDFTATGLTDTSYIYDFRYEEVVESEFLRRLGELQGDLLERFRDSAGI